MVIWVEKNSAGCYFSTLTSESINLTLSWIHIPVQPLLFRGWGKTRPAHSFPTQTSDCINLVQKLGYLGGEKLGWPILSPTWIVKVSAIPCHEYVCFRRWLTICTTVFPHLITFCMRLMFNLVMVGKEWAGPVFPHPLTSNFKFYAYSRQGNLRLAEFSPPH